MYKRTENDYIQSVHKVILYIEKNYTQDLTLEVLSKKAGFSKYHFHRIFKSVAGESIGEHIRKVRLQRTTLKFKTSQTVTQIAMQSGYETNASFSKAFKKHFGISPKAFSQNAKIQKGSKMLEPKFVGMEPIEVLYVRKTGDYMHACGQAWEVLMRFVEENTIKHKKNLMQKDTMMFGIGHDNPSVTPAQHLRCDACISWDDKRLKPEGEVLNKTIEGGKYAVFLHEGPYEELKAVYEQIGDWIVQNGPKLRDQPMFEKYLNKDPKRTKAEDLKTEIYVPLA